MGFYYKAKWEKKVNKILSRFCDTIKSRYVYSHWNMKLKKQYYFGTFCDPKILFSRIVKPPWPTVFEKSKIPQPNPEKLQLKGSKIQAILLDFKGKCWKTSKNAWILLPLNWNFSGFGWWISDFSKSVDQYGFGAYSEVKLISQFMQTKFLCHKVTQNSTVSYSRDWIVWIFEWYERQKIDKIYLTFVPKISEFRNF